MTEPTDAEIRELAATGNGVYQDDETAIWEITDPSLMKLVHDALAKWGQPAQAAEPVGCIEIEGSLGGVSVTVSAAPAAFLLSPGMHKLFTAPQPGAEPLSYEQIQDLLLCGNPTDEEMRLIRIGWDAAHASKGGQHGTE